MARRSLPAVIRQRLYAFARGLATPFTDSRRHRFLHDMIPGLVIANHVLLTEVARALRSRNHAHDAPGTSYPKAHITDCMAKDARVD